MSSVNRDSLSERDESGHPDLFADLKGKAFGLFTSQYGIRGSFSVSALYQLEEIPLCSYLLSVNSPNGCLTFSSALLLQIV